MYGMGERKGQGECLGKEEGEEERESSLILLPFVCCFPSTMAAQASLEERRKARLAGAQWDAYVTTYQVERKFAFFFTFILL